MKTKALRYNRVITGAVCMGAFLLITSSAFAQNLFVSEGVNPGGIYEYTPGGAPVTFTPTGLNYPYGLAFDSSGDLFIANCINDAGSGGYVTEITPGGVQTTIPSGPVGVVEAKLDFMAALSSSGDLPQNVNYAIKGEYLSAFLAQFPDLKLSSARPISPNNVVQSTQQSVAIVLVY